MPHQETELSFQVIGLESSEGVGGQTLSDDIDSSVWFVSVEIWTDFTSAVLLVTFPPHAPHLYVHCVHRMT